MCVIDSGVITEDCEVRPPLLANLQLAEKPQQPRISRLDEEPELVEQQPHEKEEKKRSGVSRFFGHGQDVNGRRRSALWETKQARVPEGRTVDPPNLQERKFGPWTRPSRVTIPQSLLQESTNDDADQQVSTLLHREHQATSEEIEWLHVVMGSGWPKVVQAIHRKVQEVLVPKIQDRLPRVFKDGFQLKEFNLGDQHPIIQHVALFRAPCHVAMANREARGIELHLTMSLTTDSRIKLSVLGLPVGVHGLSIKGTLVVMLDPLLTEMPIVGAVTLCFLNPPKVDMNFSGIASIADSALLANTVRSEIDSLISGAMVLPNLIAIPVGKPEQGVDRALLSEMRPLGMLQVTLLNAEDLVSHDWHLFSAPTSNPFVKLMLGDEQWQSSVVYNTTSPVWPDDESHIFEVFDRDQELWINVVEGGRFKSHDILGRARPIGLHDIFSWIDRPIPLYHPEADLESDQHDLQQKECGAIFFEFGWLSPCSFADPSAVHTMLRVKIGEVRPQFLLTASAVAIRVQVGDCVKTTPFKNVRPKSDDQTSGRKTILTSNACTSVAINKVLHVIVPAHKCHQAELKVSLVSSSSQELASKAIPMHVRGEVCFAGPSVQLTDSRGLRSEVQIQITASGLRGVNINSAKKHLRRNALIDVENPDPRKRETKAPLYRKSVMKRLESKMFKHSTFLHCEPSLGLLWINKAFSIMWPNIDGALQQIMFTSVEPRLQDRLPGPLKNVHFKSFTLGEPLKVTNIDIHSAPHRAHWQSRDFRGVEMRAMIELASISAELSVLGMTLGIRYLRVKGELVFRFEPIIPEAPVIGGVIAFFQDPPKVQMEFSGAIRVADSALLAGTVRAVIDQEIAKSLVMPNVIAKAIGREDQGVDRKLLRCPKLRGLLRVTALHAKDLVGHDWHLFSKATSDPFLKLTLSCNEWQSSVVKGTCDPVWTEADTHDFTVFDPEQKLRICVFEGGFFHVHDMLCHARSRTVAEILPWSEKPLPLYSPEEDLDHSKDPDTTCGEVFLRFEWMKLCPHSLGSDRSCVVRVRVDEVYMPASLGQVGRLHVKIEDTKKSTPFNMQATQKQDDSITCRCGSMISGEALFCPSCGSAQVNSSMTGKPKTQELAIEYILWFLVLTASLTTANAEFELADRFGNVLGKAVVPMTEVLQSPQLIWHTCEDAVEDEQEVLRFECSLNGREHKMEITAQVEITIIGLEKTVDYEEIVI